METLKTFFFFFFSFCLLCVSWCYHEIGEGGKDLFNPLLVLSFYFIPPPPMSLWCWLRPDRSRRLVLTSYRRSHFYIYFDNAVVLILYLNTGSSCGGGGGIRGSLRSFILEGHRDSILFSLSWAGAAVRLQGFFLHFHLSLFSTSTNVIFILFCSIQAISRRLEDAWIARIWRSTF